MELNIAIEKRKRMIRKISFVFISLILLLTFFSNTINNFLLPEVDVVYVRDGRITNTIQAVGTVKALNTEKVYSFSSFQISDIEIASNQRVTEGMVLAYVNQDNYFRQIERIEHEIRNLEIDIQNFENEFKNIYSVTASSELKSLEREVQLRLKELNTAKKLFETGEKTETDILNAQTNYENTKSNYDISSKIFENRKKEYGLNYEKMQNTLEFSKSELKNVRSNVLENGEILSPVDGIVKNIYIEKGMNITEGQLLFEIIPVNETAAVVWNLSTEKAELLNVGDRVEFEADIPEKILLHGEVEEKEYLFDQNQYEFTSYIDIEDAERKNGMSINVSVTIVSNTYDMIVSNSAIRKENDREYIYVIRGEEGPLGKETYAERVYITIEDSDIFNSAIRAVLDSDAMVVSHSSKPLFTDKIQVKVR